MFRQEAFCSAYRSQIVLQNNRSSSKKKNSGSSSQKKYFFSKVVANFVVDRMGVDRMGVVANFVVEKLKLSDRSRKIVRTSPQNAQPRFSPRNGRSPDVSHLVPNRTKYEPPLISSPPQSCIIHPGSVTGLRHQSCKIHPGSVTGLRHQSWPCTIHPDSITGLR